MDILGFALYHENNDVAPSNASVGEKRVQVTDESESDSDDSEPKRRKLEEIDDGGSPLQDLQARIWEQLEQNDGELPLEEVASDVEDRSLVQKAIEQLAEDGRLLLDDGVVCQI
jgi:hypothetical protein